MTYAPCSLYGSQQHAVISMTQQGSLKLLHAKPNHTVLTVSPAGCHWPNQTLQQYLTLQVLSVCKEIGIGHLLLHQTTGLHSVSQSCLGSKSGKYLHTQQPLSICVVKLCQEGLCRGKSSLHLENPIFWICSWGSWA